MAFNDEAKRYGNAVKWVMEHTSELSVDDMILFVESYTQFAKTCCEIYERCRPKETSFLFKMSDEDLGLFK